MLHAIKFCKKFFFKFWVDFGKVLSTFKKNNGKLCYLVKFIKILNKMFEKDTKKNWKFWKNNQKILVIFKKNFDEPLK